MIGAVAAGIGLIVSCAITARIPDLIQSPRLFLSLVVVACACYAAGIWCLTNLHGPRPMVEAVVRDRLPYVKIPVQTLRSWERRAPADWAKVASWLAAQNVAVVQV